MDAFTASLRTSFPVRDVRRGWRGRKIDDALRRLLCSARFDCDVTAVRNAERLRDYRAAGEIRQRYSRAALTSMLVRVGHRYATENLVRRSPAYRSMQRRLGIRKAGAR